MFGLLLGLSITARNQDSKRLESLAVGVFHVKAIYIDSQGVKWFGTNRGLCRYDNLTWRYYTEQDHLAGDEVMALVMDPNAPDPELWVATNRGVSMLVLSEDGIRFSGTSPATT